MFNPYLQSYNQIQPTYTQPTGNAPQDERIWVSNQQAGEAYLISPSGFARLWDSSCNRFYEKRADSTGRPLPMEIYEYKKITPTYEVSEINKSSFDEINEKIEVLNERIDKLEQIKKGAMKNGKQSSTDDTSVQSV